MASSAGATKGSSPLVSIRDGASAERPLAEALADTATVPKKEGVFPTLRKTERFSAYHPMIPKRYIPAWQVDMKNRKLIIKVRYKWMSNSYVLGNGPLMHKARGSSCEPGVTAFWGYCFAITRYNLGPRGLQLYLEAAYPLSHRPCPCSIAACIIIII